VSIKGKQLTEMNQKDYRIGIWPPQKQEKTLAQ
jgi:hypothetical protein